VKPDMNLSDFGYLLLMMLWSAVVVWLSYRLGYDNGRWAAQCRMENEECRRKGGGGQRPEVWKKLKS